MGKSKTRNRESKENNSMDKEIRRIIAVYPSLRGRLKRDRSSGCLEYVGPESGPSAYNPILNYTTPRGKSASILLRRWVWLSHKKKIPVGKFPIMACRNYRCHEYKHEYLGNKFSKYRLFDPKINRLLTPDIVIVLRYFQGKATQQMLSRCFSRISLYRIKKVHSRKIFPEIVVPRGYKPPNALVEKLENISRRRAHYRRYFGPNTVHSALQDISQSNLSLREKRILRQYVQKTSVQEIRKEEGISRARVYIIINSALRKLCSQYGDKRWFLLLSRPSSMYVYREVY